VFQVDDYECNDFGETQEQHGEFDKLVDLQEKEVRRMKESRERRQSLMRMKCFNAGF
jgi:hypothetical protein